MLAFLNHYKLQICWGVRLEERKRVESERNADLVCWMNERTKIFCERLIIRVDRSVVKSVAVRMILGLSWWHVAIIIRVWNCPTVDPRQCSRWGWSRPRSCTADDLGCLATGGLTVDDSFTSAASGLRDVLVKFHLSCTSWSALAARRVSCLGVATLSRSPATTGGNAHANEPGTIYWKL